MLGKSEEKELRRFVEYLREANLKEDKYEFENTQWNQRLFDYLKYVKLFKKYNVNISLLKIAICEYADDLLSRSKEAQRNFNEIHTIILVLYKQI